jgi:seryl-tRNA synthetase
LEQEKKRLTKEIQNLTELKVSQGNIIKEQNKQVKELPTLKEEIQELKNNLAQTKQKNWEQLTEILSYFDQQPSTFSNYSTLLNFFKQVAAD